MQHEHGTFARKLCLIEKDELMLGLDLLSAFYGVEYLIIIVPLWWYSQRYTIRGFMKRIRRHL